MELDLRWRYRAFQARTTSHGALVVASTMSGLEHEPPPADPVPASTGDGRPKFDLRTVFPKQNDELLHTVRSTL